MVDLIVTCVTHLEPVAQRSNFVDHCKNLLYPLRLWHFFVSEIGTKISYKINIFLTYHKMLIYSPVILSLCTIPNKSDTRNSLHIVNSYQLQSLLLEKFKSFIQNAFMLFLLWRFNVLLQRLSYVLSRTY